jgi:hypothetical protein
VLFPKRFWAGLADGSVTVAFRRWRRPTVKAGGTLQSPGGLLAIDEVSLIEPADITPADVRAAGYGPGEDPLAGLKPDGALHRIRFHRLGDDPRIDLRQRDDLSDDDLAGLRRALDRLPWSVPILRVIDRHPGVVSTELAPLVGFERQAFKQRVRRLKELGLTESLEVGYRLSPRGAALLARVSEAHG